MFGPYLAHLGVIEFEKRGYPHAHLVYTFKSEGPQHLNEMDKWVWARIPDESIANGPFNVNAPCMQLDRSSNRKKCNKKFTQPFRSTATINDKTGRVEYTRVKNEKDKPTVRMMVDGKWTNVPLGDEWVASYNPYLLPGIAF